jgi:hypothetical protein
MEYILDQHGQPYNLKHPLICFDERPCQLIDDYSGTHTDEARKAKKDGYEYRHNSTCCVFIAFDTHEGKRATCFKKHRTLVDYSDFMKGIALRYPDAESIKVVKYNLNTNSASPFYESFSPEEAFELIKTFEYQVQ